MYYNRNRIGQLITRVALTLCLSLALCLNMGIPSLSAEQTSGRMTELFWNIATSLTEKSCLATLLFGVLLSVNRRIDGRKTERRILFPLVGGGDCADLVDGGGIPGGQYPMDFVRLIWTDDEVGNLFGGNYLWTESDSIFPLHSIGGAGTETVGKYLGRKGDLVVSYCENLSGAYRVGFFRDYFYSMVASSDSRLSGQLL